MSEITPAPQPIDSEPRTNREAITRALNRAKDVAEKKQVDTLSPEDVAKRRTFLTSLERVQDSENKTFENTFTNLETGEEYTQQEGIPVEWAITQLREEAKEHPEGSDERKALQSDARLLQRNSRRYEEFADRMDPDQLVNRVRQEAKFISQDERKQADDVANYFAGEHEVLGRRELVMPKERTLRTRQSNDIDAPPAVEPPPLDTPDNPPIPHDIDDQDTDTIPPPPDPDPQPSDQPEPLDTNDQPGTADQVPADANDENNPPVPDDTPTDTQPTNVTPPTPTSNNTPPVQVGTDGGQTAYVNPVVPATPPVAPAVPASSTPPAATSSPTPPSSSAPGSTTPSPITPPGTSSTPITPSSPVVAVPSASPTPPSPDAGGTPPDASATPSPESEKVDLILGRNNLFTRAARMIGDKFYEQQMADWKLKDPRTWMRNAKLRMSQIAVKEQYYKEALKLLRETKNPFAEVDLATKTVTNGAKQLSDFSESEQSFFRISHRNAAGEIDTAGQKIEKLETTDVGKRLNDLIVSDVLRPYVDSSLTKEQMEQKLRELVDRNITHPDFGPLLKDFFGNTSVEHDTEMLNFYTDLAEYGDKLRSDKTVHAHAIANLEQNVQIRLADIRQGSMSKDEFSRADKMIHWFQRGKYRKAFTLPALAGVTAATATTGVLASTGARIGGLSVPIVGTIVGTSMALARRDVEAFRERAIQNRREVYGEKVPAGAKTREALGRTIISKASIGQLLDGDKNRQTPNGENRGINELVRLALLPVDNTDPAQAVEHEVIRQKLFDATAEAKARLDYSFQIGRDFLTFDSIGTNIQGYDKLEEGIVRAFDALKKTQGPNEDVLTQFKEKTGKWKEILNQDKEKADKAFNSYRLQEAGKTALVSAVTGMIAAPLTQEGLALAGRGLGLNVGQTGLEMRFNQLANSSVGQATGMDSVRDGVGNAVSAVGGEQLLPHMKIDTLEGFKNLYNNAGGQLELPNGYKVVAGAVQGTEHPVMLQDSTGKALGSFFVEPNGHIVMPKAAKDQLPADIKALLDRWPTQDTTAHALSQKLLDAKNAGSGTVEIPNPQNPNLTIKMQVTGENVLIQGMKATGKIGPNGELTLSGPDKAQLLQAQTLLQQQGLPAGAVIDSSTRVDIPPIHKQIQDEIAKIQPGNATGSKVEFPGGPGMKDMNITLFTDGSNKVSISGPGLHAPVVGTFTSEGNFLFDQSANPDHDFSKLFTGDKANPGILEQAGFTGGQKTVPIPNATNLENLAAQVAAVSTPERASFSTGIETGDTGKQWNFHTLLREYTDRTGNHTGNELSLHLGGYNGVTGEPGVISTNATITGGQIPARIEGLPPMTDAVLNAIIERNNGLKYDNMFAIVDLHDGRQFMLPLNADGNVKLPEGYFDPTTGEPRGIKSIAISVLEKPDGSVLSPQELQSTGSLPEGMRVHSLAAEDWEVSEPLLTEPTPEPPGLKIERTDTQLHIAPPDVPVIQENPNHYFIVDPVKNIELTPPLVDTMEAPAIPLPFAPRWFEDMEPKRIRGPYGAYFGTVINAERKVLLDANRSKTLRDNPNAELDFQTEAKAYLDKQNPDYLAEIKYLANEITESPSPNLKLMVCIPVAGHQEGDNIYTSLENYLYQDLAKDQFEILLFVNQPEHDKDGNVINPDKTAAEIARFKKDHPELAVKVFSKVFPTEQARIGNIRKYLNDVALLRHVQRNKGADDIILVSNDADNKGIAPAYLRNFIEKFDKNPKVDGILGQLDWDPDAYVKNPFVYTGTRLFQFMNAIGRKNSNRMVSSGANFAFKGSMYSAIGGYIDPDGGGEDIAIGEGIILARQDQDARSRVVFGGANVSRMYTSARRAIKAWEEGVPPLDQWKREFSAFDDDVRKLNLDSTVDFDFNNPDAKSTLKTGLESVINATIDYCEQSDPLPEGKNNQFYRRALKYMGIEYSVKDGRMEIKNIEPIIINLKYYQQQAVLLQKVKSGKGTQQMTEELRKLDDARRRELEDYYQEIATQEAPMVIRQPSLQDNPAPSPDIIADPSVQLSRFEISKYLNRQNPAYLQQLNELNNSIWQKMEKGTTPDEGTKAVVCIPVAGHQEMSNIYDTLASFNNQTLPKNNFELLLFVNSPEDVIESKKNDIQKTLQQIRQAQEDFPGLRIRVAKAALPQDQVRIGNIRKIVSDLALLRQAEVGITDDILIINNDADNEGVSSTYLETYLDYFKNNPDKDGAVGNLLFDPEGLSKLPALFAQTEFVTRLDKQGFTNGNVNLYGSNSAMKSSIYAAIGGYPSALKTAEQEWTGDTIRNLRHSKETLGYAGDNTLLVTNARRSIASALSGLDGQIAFGDIDAEEKMRLLDTKALPDFNFDDPASVHKLKDDISIVMNSLVRKYEEGDLIGKEARYYKDKLEAMGITYHVDGDPKDIESTIIIDDISNYIDRQKQIVAMIKTGETNMATIYQRIPDITAAPATPPTP